MVGDKDETVPVKLWDAKRPCFERGQENQFIASYPQEIGELSYVQIWHNNAGETSSKSVMRRQIPYKIWQKQVKKTLSISRSPNVCVCYFILYIGIYTYLMMTLICH